MFITNIQSAEAIEAHPKIISISRCVAYSLYTYNIYDSSYPLLIIQFQFYSHSRSIILSHKIPFYSIQSSRSRKRIINFFLCLLIHSFLLSTFPSLVLPFCMYIFCRSVFFSCFFFLGKKNILGILTMWVDVKDIILIFFKSLVKLPVLRIKVWEIDDEA